MNPSNVEAYGSLVDLHAQTGNKPAAVKLYVGDGCACHWLAGLRPPVGFPFTALFLCATVVRCSLQGAPLTVSQAYVEFKLATVHLMDVADLTAAMLHVQKSLAYVHHCVTGTPGLPKPRVRVL